MVKASRSFIHRISELSFLEGETVRQEKLKKMRKARKPPSWQSPSSQSRRSRIKTFESVPTTSEQNKTFRTPCSSQWLVLTACLSSVVLISCSTWLVFIFWDSWPELILSVIIPTAVFTVVKCSICCNKKCWCWILKKLNILYYDSQHSVVFHSTSAWKSVCFTFLMASNGCYVILPYLHFLLYHQYIVNAVRLGSYEIVLNIS